MWNLFKRFSPFFSYIWWRIKYAWNSGKTSHKVTFSTRQLTGAGDATITLYGNKKIVGLLPVRTPADMTELFHTQTDSERLIPLDIDMLKLEWNAQDNDRWYVDWIQIDQRPRFYFHKWITSGTYYSRTDTCLPQDEENQEADDFRKIRVALKRAEYGFELYNIENLETETIENLDLPVKIRKIPKGEKFSFLYKMKYLIIPLIKMKLSEFLIKLRLFWLKSWSNWDQIDSAYHLYFKKPEGEDQWMEDFHFGQQRINECNWSLIRRIVNTDEISNNFNDDQINTLGRIMGIDPDDAVQDQNLFITSMGIVEGLNIPNPVALFHNTGDDRGLVPVAIKLLSGPNTPAFFPIDDDPHDYSWLAAKMWCNVADASVHLGVVHLGFTHILMEGIAICMHRNLSEKHPIFKLLAPHFHYNIAINDLARQRLLQPGGYIDQITNIKVNGIYFLIAAKLENWRMDVDGTVPADLSNRGILVDGNIILPCFYYANDALAMYNVIKEYVTRYVKYYYCEVNETDPADRLKDDYEIQAFCADLIRPRNADNGGLGINGVPVTEMQFQTQLIDTITSIIVTCSVTHAATNFPQYQQYGFPPNYATKLRTFPPTTQVKMTKRQIIDSLPSVDETFSIMEIFSLLSQETTKRLGYFDVQIIKDPGIQAIVNQFTEDLDEAGKQIRTRNETIERNNNARHQANKVVFSKPYTRLLPENIPNSIAI